MRTTERRRSRHLRRNGPCSPDEALDPNTPPSRLLTCAGTHPEQVLENVVLPILALSDPVLWRRLVEVAWQSVPRARMAALCGAPIDAYHERVSPVVTTPVARTFVRWALDDVADWSGLPGDRSLYAIVKALDLNGNDCESFDYAEDEHELTHRPFWCLCLAYDAHASLVGQMAPSLGRTRRSDPYEQQLAGVLALQREAEVAAVERMAALLRVRLPPWPAPPFRPNQRRAARRADTWW
jgi:hypothetical protein